MPLNVVCVVDIINTKRLIGQGFLNARFLSSLPSVVFDIDWRIGVERNDLLCKSM